MTFAGAFLAVDIVPGVGQADPIRQLGHLRGVMLGVLGKGPLAVQVQDLAHHLLILS